MNITAEKAKEIATEVSRAQYLNIVEKAEFTILPKIEEEIINAANHGLRQNNIGLRLMLAADFSDLTKAKTYIAKRIREKGFTAQWDAVYNFTIIVKW